MIPSARARTLDHESMSLLFTHARSALRWAQTPVSQEVIEAAYELIKFGPTGNNSMPLRVVVAESDSARAAVIAAASEANRAKLTAAPLIVVVAADLDYHELVHITAPNAEGLRERLAARPDARAANAKDNTWLQTGYLIAGLRAQGLAVRPIGGFDKEALNASLLEGRAWQSQLLLAVGYPHEDGDLGVGERAGRPSWEHAGLVL